MAHAYTPGLKVLQHSKIKKERRLPIKGEVHKNIGDIVEADERRSIDSLVDTLMGKKADLRFEYIKTNAISVLDEIDI